MQAGSDGADESTLETSSPSYALAIDRHLKSRDLKQAWRLFLQIYTSRDCPAFTNPSFNDVRLLNGVKIFSQLSAAIATEFCKGSDVLASPTAVLFRYEQLGIARPEMWIKAITHVTNQFLWSTSGAASRTRDAESILVELLALWRLFFQCKGQQEVSLESLSSEWNSIPDGRSLSGFYSQTNFGRRLQNYHPEMLGGPALQFSAIVLFNVFEGVNQSSMKVPDSLREQSAPFIGLITHLLAGSNINTVFKHTEVSVDFKALPDDFRKLVIDQINSAPVQAMKLVGMQSGTHSSEQELSEAEKTSNLEEFYLKRIARAVLSQSHAGKLGKLWEEVTTAYKSTDHSTAIPPLIYNAFLSGFMSLYQSEQAVAVWNHMIAHGVKPGMRTWVAMLEGCVKAKDLNGMDAVWERMLRSGSEPDNYAWTTRIHGLITLRQIARAFNALDEMGKKWLSAEKVIKHPQKRGKGAKKVPSNTKLVNSFTKPSIEVINGAISALVQIPEQGLRFPRKVDFTHKVLQWAGNFDIKPDARTYNILIQLYLNAGDYPTTFKLLRQMEKEGLEGDLATHTMLIRAAFDNQKFDDLSNTEQADRILKLFSELESGGLKLNTYVYSSTIDRLLKQYGNFTAVRAVMDHMRSRNLVVSPHIYTSLATHYFQQDPPDIQAVDSLLMQIFGPPRAPTDKILFDRVIEGYAIHGEVGKMMSVLTRMSAHGKLPGWRALTAVVRALAEAGDWERARLVVRDVQMGEGVAKGGVTGGMPGQRAFFAVVRELGGGLEETLAGEYLRRRPANIEAAMSEQSAAEGAAEMLDATQKGEAQEMEAQQAIDDEEFVNAQHVSYLSDAPEPDPRQQ